MNRITSFAAFTALQEHFEVHFPNQEKVPPIIDTKNKAPAIPSNITIKERSSTPPVIDRIKVVLEHDLRVKVSVPWQQKAWIQKIKSLPNRAWNKEHQYWSVPKTKATLLELQQLFGEALQVDNGIKWRGDNTIVTPTTSKSINTYSLNF